MPQLVQKATADFPFSRTQTQILELSLAKSLQWEK
jgi:hypothetical protein